MDSIRIDSGHFSADISAFIRLLHTHGVRYLVVGGQAVILHGHVRLTGDVDFFYSRDPANVEHLYDALNEFWDGDVPGLDSAEDLGSEGAIVQFGVPPNRIDLINEIEGVDFEKAWSGRVECQLITKTGDVPLHYIGLEELIENKKAVGRPKDLDDLDYLGSRR